MWTARTDLRRLGFRKANTDLWLCTRRYGLRPGDHLTLHDHGPSSAPWIDLSAFHWTHEVGGERLHVYYREEAPGVWVAEGRTPWQDVRRLGACPQRLQAEGDTIAARLVAAMGGSLYRGSSEPEGPMP